MLVGVVWLVAFHGDGFTCRGQRSIWNQDASET